MQLTIDTTEHDPARTMFLRMGIASGVDEETGVKIEVSMSGSRLILERQEPTESGDEFGAGRTIHTIDLAGLVQTWVAALDA